MGLSAVLQWIWIWELQGKASLYYPSVNALEKGVVSYLLKLLLPTMLSGKEVQDLVSVTVIGKRGYCAKGPPIGDIPVPAALAFHGGREHEFRSCC